MLSVVRRRVAALDGNAREVLSGATVAFVLRGIGAALAFAFNVAIGRLIGAEGAGLYFLALSVAMIGSVVARMGLDNTLLRYVASGASSGDWARAKGVVALGLRNAGIAGLALAALGFAFAPILAVHLFDRPDLTSHLRVMSLAMLAFSAMTLMAEALKGLKHIAASMLASGVLYPAAGLLLIWPAVQGFGPLGASFAYLGGTTLAALFGWAMWRRAVATNAAAPAFPQAELLASSRPLWVMAILNRGVLQWAPLFLLGVWGTAEETGVFGAATRVAMLVSLLLMAVNTAIAPKFAELYQCGEMEALARLARRFALYVTLAASPLLALLILAGDHVMGLFGPEFRSGGTALAILAAGQAVNVATGSVGYLLMMSGHERDARTAAIIGAVGLAVLSPMLIPAYGAIGAAALTAITLAITQVTLATLVMKQLGIVLVPLLRGLAE